jgi:DNA-binding transcriptional ArsR family regulator
MTDPGAVLSALSDPTRRAIVQRLALGPATATQLAELAPMSRPAVSQHLRVLREAELVRGTQQGRFVFYELAGPPLLEAHAWLGALVDRWASAPTLNDARSSAAKDRT